MFQSPGAIAVHMGPIAIRWYGVLMATAMALGLFGITLLVTMAQFAILDRRVHYS